MSALVEKLRGDVARRRESAAKRYKALLLRGENLSDDEQNEMLDVLTTLGHSFEAIPEHLALLVKSIELRALQSELPGLMEAEREAAAARRKADADFMAAEQAARERREAEGLRIAREFGPRTGRAAAARAAVGGLAQIRRKLDDVFGSAWKDEE